MTQKAFYIFDPISLKHNTGEGHPESFKRLEAILPVLKRLLPSIESEIASYNDLELAHEKNYVKETLNFIPNEGMAALDADTIVSEQSGQAALYSAGNAIKAVDEIIDNKANFIFNLSRPPGHHATKSKAGGFCLFNNIAISAIYALKKRDIKKIAIIDFDVHHGNGTQDIMWNEENCLFVSSHQSPLYPYSGDENETGKNNNILNIPLPADSDGKLMQQIYKDKIFPKIREFNPDFIFVSAGFDAHKDDLISNLNWVASDYAWLGNEIMKLANDVCENKVMACLEGGYNLDALASSVNAFVKPFIKEK